MKKGYVLTNEELDFYGDQFQESKEKADGITFEQYLTNLNKIHPLTPTI